MLTCQKQAVRYCKYYSWISYFAANNCSIWANLIFMPAASCSSIRLFWSSTFWSMISCWRCQSSFYKNSNRCLCSLRSTSNCVSSISCCCLEFVLSSSMQCNSNVSFFSAYCFSKLWQWSWWDHNTWTCYCWPQKYQHCCQEHCYYYFAFIFFPAGVAMTWPTAESSSESWFTTSPLLPRTITGPPSWTISPATILVAVLSCNVRRSWNWLAASSCTFLLRFSLPLYQHFLFRKRLFAML